VINLDEKKPYLFLSLSWFAFIIFLLVLLLLNYLIYPRLIMLNSFFLNFVFILSSLVFAIVGGGLLLLTLTSLTSKDLLWPHGKKQVTVKVLFPIVLLLGKLLKISNSKVRESYVHLNNRLVDASRKRITTDKILILLPHCIQYSECDIRIIYEIDRCKRCGKCIIKDVVDFVENIPGKVAVATGGTLARKIILDYKPDFIIAVACDRDMVSGINDVYPIPVYGILNQRPNGPCFNTTFDMQELREVYSNFTK